MSVNRARTGSLSDSNLYGMTADGKHESCRRKKCGEFGRGRGVRDVGTRRHANYVAQTFLSVTRFG